MNNLKLIKSKTHPETNKVVEYKVELEDGPYVGDIYLEVEGFYVFSPLTRGYYESHDLRKVADKLEELNKEWMDKLQKELK